VSPYACVVCPGVYLEIEICAGDNGCRKSPGLERGRQVVKVRRATRNARLDVEVAVVHVIGDTRCHVTSLDHRMNGHSVSQVATR
jgi:hypothetical protein